MHKFPYQWRIGDGYPAPGVPAHGSPVFSTFSCGGGSSMGYKLAGYHVVGACDIDPRMMAIYRANHHPRHAFVESITTLKTRGDLPAELYDLAVFDGSPPCSSFSLAGNREDDWGTEKVFKEGQASQVLDTLFFDWIELAKTLQAKVVVAENVKGLMLGDARAYVRRIYTELDAAGYHVQHFLLNAATMGVPQRRERVFFIGLRKDLAGPFMEYKDLFTRAPALTLDFNEPGIPFGAYRDEVGGDPGNRQRAELVRMRVPSDRTVSDINERLYGKVSGFNSAILPDDDVAPTITAGEVNWRHHDGLLCTDREYTLASTFPLDYDFGAEAVKYVVGMSVPPVMMAQVASAVYEQWLSKL